MNKFAVIRKLRLLMSALFCASVMCIAAQAQSVVINKYQNSGTTSDIIELLVVQDSLDMRGMIIKDFSSSMANDGGGKFQFSTDALWSSVRSGTLIVLRNTNSAADASASGSDYNLDIGLQNTTYFANLGGAFDIATTELVMIKVAGSGAAGVTGSIHGLAGGTAGAQFTSAAPPKLRATGTSGTGQFVFANNSTQTLADFNGTDATGAATGLTFGTGNNANNTAFINSLRTTTAVTEPTTPASNVQFSSIGSNSLTVSWTNGNGSSRLVLAKQASSVDGNPADGTAYTANSAFGSGSQVGSGNFAVFSGTGNTVNVTGLSPGITYHFAVYEFNGSGASADYLIVNPARGSQTTAAAFSISGQIIQAAGGAGGSGITVALSGSQSATTTTDANGNYTFSGVTGGGSYTVTPTSAGFTFTPASSSISNLGSNQVLNFSAKTKIIISEFRFRGTDPDDSGSRTGAANEFVELYNQTNAPVDISGFAVVSSDNPSAAKFVAPGAAGSNTTVIRAYGNYLITGQDYNLTSYSSADGTFNGDILDGGGVALFTGGGAFAAGNRLDSVGFSGSPALFNEGTPLSPAGGIVSDSENSFVRLFDNTGLPKDSNNNNGDFILIATDAAVYSGVQSVLGAPGPQNRNSPIFRSGDFTAGLIDSGASSTAVPNRVRDAGNTSSQNPLGTLAIRRRYTNNTGNPVTTMRMRVIGITTIGSAPAYSPQAVLRALSSANITVTSADGQRQIAVKGITLEQPPIQINGGGLNSSFIINLDGSLAAGDGVNVDVLLGIVANGRLVFNTQIESVSGAVQSSNIHLTMGNPSNAVMNTNQPCNYLLEKSQYVLSYCSTKNQANWVSWHLDPSWLGSTPRQDDFREDTTLPAGFYQVQETDYQFATYGFDRGHHTASADRTATVPDNSATFLMSNMMPQSPDNNQGPWNNMEQDLRTLVTGSGKELYIVMGGAGTGGTTASGTFNNIVTPSGQQINVPNQVWKVIIVLDRAAGDDVARVTTSTRVIAVIMPNTSGIRNNDWRQYRVSVDQVETLTGFNFFSNVPDNIENVIESTVDNQ